jgi:outer membrane protein assembly factor BamB
MEKNPMKKIYSVLLIALAVIVMLTGCSSRAITTGWPGITVDGETAYVARTNVIYAINSANGVQRWQFPSESSASVYFYAPPLVTDQYIVAGSYSGVLYAIDPSTGSEVWNFSMATGRYIATPVMAGDLILAPNGDKHLYAIDQDGVLQWSFEADSAIWASPLVDGDVVYVASLGHTLYALSLEDQSILWQADLEGGLTDAPVLVDGALYIGTLGAEVIKLDASTGEILWRVTTPGSVWATPIVQDDVVYLADQSGTVQALSAANGSSIWTVNLEGQVIGSLLPVEDGLIVVNSTGSVLKFNLDGAQVWTQPINGTLYSDPKTAGDYILVGINDGDQLIQAVGLDGAMMWTFTPAE